MAVCPFCVNACPRPSIVSQRRAVCTRQHPASNPPKLLIAQAGQEAGSQLLKWRRPISWRGGLATPKTCFLQGFSFVLRVSFIFTLSVLCVSFAGKLTAHENFLKSGDSVRLTEKDIHRISWLAMDELSHNTQQICSRVRGLPGAIYGLARLAQHSL